MLSSVMLIPNCNKLYLDVIPETLFRRYSFRRLDYSLIIVVFLVILDLISVVFR